MSIISLFNKWPIRTFLVLTITILFIFPWQGHAHASLSTTQLSNDPYTNSSAEHQTEAEPDIFSYGSTIVSTFQVGRFTHGGASNIGWATSTDGGKTWTNGFLPGITKVVDPGNPYDGVTDPAVAYDASHKVWLISSLAVTVTYRHHSPHDHFPAVLVSRSTDGGLTWSNPIKVNQPKGKTITNLDKDWIVCDNTATSPFYGNCYAEWDIAKNYSIQMSTSTDGGLTWGTARGTADHATGVGGQPLVQPGGTVVVPIDNANASAVLAFTSSDGGTSWSSTVTVAAVNAHPVSGNLRSAPIISAAIDASGIVYVVWPDCRFESGCSANDLVMSTSADGITWSPVQLIPADSVGSGVDHFIPGLGADPLTSGSSAHLVVAFYYYPKSHCNFSTCQLNVGYSSSIDGGATWTPSTHIAGPMSLSWLARTNMGRMVGDYIATTFSGGLAFPAIAIATRPGGGPDCIVGAACHEAIYTVSTGLM